MIVIGVSCLIISQVRFETHDLVLWPFLVFTVTYFLYQVISLPVNFTGRGFDLAAHQARIRGLASAVVPRRGHLPADLRRADRGAAQHLDRRGRADRGVPGRGAGLRPGRRAARGGPRDGRVVRLQLHAPAATGRRQEGRQPALRVRPDQRASTSSSWTPTSRRAATSWPRRCPTWTIPRSPSSRRRSTSGPARRRPGSSGPPGRSRRCSTGRSRWPGTGSTRPSAAGPRRSTGGPRWSRRAARR